LRSIGRCFGKKVERQEYYNDYCSYLLGRPPEREDILLNEDSDGRVIYDGKCWRVFDLDKYSCD